MSFLILFCLLINVITARDPLKQKCDEKCIASASTLDICFNGECLKCDSETLNCNLLSEDGCEVFARDVNNCGTCGNDCMTTSNKNGFCVGEGPFWCDDCPELYENCDLDPNNGCEVYLLDNNMHCGGCGNKCIESMTCNMGVCQCHIGYDLCDNECVDLSNDNQNHCGSCGNKCDDDKKCVDYTCQ